LQQPSNLSHRAGAAYVTDSLRYGHRDALPTASLRPRDILAREPYGFDEAGLPDSCRQDRSLGVKLIAEPGTSAGRATQVSRFPPGLA